ncbi:hypothetical protein KOI35_25420 [Actinoplanes bogorensis]|uniref:PD-(D/E)XK nuclease superfamily protein n=1 Tax=Paractinoplanes bogorensis TaxID=1610840 RepID=A0ABS5YU49_9ACTN|nr:hypothetical protein [Actinoplanes bogorensis]MBU2666856.1 hypothetical protein [Actinoplanes bogorensis]
MEDAVAYRALRYLLRSQRHPENAANDTLMALLSDDHALRVAFLAAVGRLGRRDLSACHIQRESHTVDAGTGKPSRRDFLLSQGTLPSAIIETKIDSSLTSGDQAARYFDQLAGGGLLMLVTRKPLVAALAAGASAQLNVPLEQVDGIHRGRRDGRDVLVLSWSRLLEDVSGPDGRKFGELAAFEAAVEGVSDFVPFGADVNDVSAGRTVRQAARVGELMVEEIRRRLGQPDNSIRIDRVSTPWNRGSSVWTKVTIREHQLWVGYSARQWAVTPGDPDNARAGNDPARLPSPFWVGRFHESVRGRQHDPAVVAARRERLDRLGVARPLEVLLGVSERAVVDHLVEEALEHIRAISDGLHADPDLAADGPGAEVDEDPELAADGPGTDVDEDPDAGAAGESN